MCSSEIKLINHFAGLSAGITRVRSYYYLKDPKWKEKVSDMFRHELMGLYGLFIEHSIVFKSLVSNRPPLAS